MPLKKTVILSYLNGEKPEKVTVSTSTDWGTPEKTRTLDPLDYDFIVDSEDGSLTLPKSAEDARIVKYLASFPETLATLGLKVSTGLVIDSRCKGMIFSSAMDGCVPLIRPSAILGGQVRFPQPKVGQYIAAIDPRIIQKNKNMLLI